MKKMSTELVVKKKNFFQKLIDSIRGISYKQDVPKEEKHNYERNDFRRKMKVKNNGQSKIKKEKTKYVAVSDLHGDINRWNGIKNALKKNPNLNIIMLGDATDRKPDGLEILLQIKELSDKGRITYLPGNHDTFIYNYIQARMMLKGMPKNEQSSRLESKLNFILEREQYQLTHNGGAKTLAELKKFSSFVDEQIQKGNLKQKISRKELAEWLGKQPIQMKLKQNDKTYAISHAFFDSVLYNYDQEYNLEKAFQSELSIDSTVFNHFNMAMWYREHDPDTHYVDEIFPVKHVMIVGHTRQENGINSIDFKGNKDQQMIMIDNSRGEGFNLTTGKCITFEQEREIQGAR